MSLVTAMFKKGKKNSYYTVTEDRHYGMEEMQNASIISSQEETVGQGQEEEWVRMVPGDKFPNQGQYVRRRLLSLAAMLFIEVGIPLALYYGLKNVVGVVYALVISGIPPVLWVIFQFIRKRKLDILGVIIALSFILSGVVSIVNNDPRAALIRDQAVGAVIGLMFLLTLIPIRTKWIDIRPLTFILVMQIYEDLYYRWTDRDGNHQEQKYLHWQWNNVKIFRISMYIQSAGWAFFLIMGLVACILMVNIGDLSIDQIVMLNTIIGIGATVSVMSTVSIVFLIVGRKAAMRIGKAWTAENDFTEKFNNQGREQHFDNNDNSNSVADSGRSSQHYQNRNQNDNEYLLADNSNSTEHYI